jgi:hypothetical protein
MSGALPGLRRMLLCGLLFMQAALAEPVWQTQIYAPAPVDNPLKGLVPYANPANPDGFPFSMEFSYIALSAVMTGPDRYDWASLERLLNDIAGRGHQSVVRFYTEYPGKKNSLPAFLLDGGLRVFRSQRPSTPPRPPVGIETPDYENPALRSALRNFIAAFGKRYDGDPRIGFITAGLLGHWGEWHDYPLESQFASKAVQSEVMDAYEAAFHTTPILLRYPAGDSDARYVGNATRAFGYHDDSFAWSTLSDKNAWHFVPLTKKAGDAAMHKWQTQPIGGEIRPEAWGKVFDAAPDDARIENFRQCVDATHVSWLMDSGMFKSSNPAERRQRALEEVRHMGYEFHVSKVSLGVEARLNVALKIENRGVAPFYYAWPLELALLDGKGQLVRVTISPLSLKGILPGSPTTYEHAIDISGIAAGRYRVLLRVPNPLPAGKPVRFANARQDVDVDGWLTLGEISLP